MKHSWLGRFRHEAVAVKAVAGQPLIVYSGCDRHGGHLYRFVSDKPIRDPADPANSELFSAGRLEVARFDPPSAKGGEGRGRWLPLEPTTPVTPLTPGHFARHGVEQAILLPHSDRRKPGAEAFASEAAVAAYRRRFATLADLYPGEGEERMGAILIDAHLAACAIGATPAARPEDTVIDPISGELLIAFTAGGGSGDGRADPAIFRGPKGQASWPYGWVMGLADDGPARGGAFRWRLVATGGAPWQGGMGFANPDNLAVDRQWTLWMVTDRSTKSADLDLFGNNSCWVLPSRGPHAGEAFCFATGPMECELTGPCFDTSESTLFLAVHHPGEDNGTRPSAAAREAQAHRLVDRSGRPFEQLRWGAAGLQLALRRPRPRPPPRGGGDSPARRRAAAGRSGGAGVEGPLDLIKGLIERLDRRRHGGVAGLGGGPLVVDLAAQLLQAAIDGLQPGGQGQQAGLPFVHALTRRMQVAAQLVDQPPPLVAQGTLRLPLQGLLLPRQAAGQLLMIEALPAAGFQQGPPFPQPFRQLLQPLAAELDTAEGLQVARVGEAGHRLLPQGQRRHRQAPGPLQGLLQPRIEALVMEPLAAAAPAGRPYTGQQRRAGEAQPDRRRQGHRKGHPGGPHQQHQAHAADGDRRRMVEGVGPAGRRRHQNAICRSSMRRRMLSAVPVVKSPPLLSAIRRSTAGSKSPWLP